MPSSTGRVAGHAAVAALAIACFASISEAQIVFPGQAPPQGMADSWRAPPASSSFGHGGTGQTGYGQPGSPVAGFGQVSQFPGGGTPYPSFGAAPSGGNQAGAIGPTQQGYASGGAFGQQQPGQQRVAPVQQREPVAEAPGATQAPAERAALGQRPPEEEVPVAAMRSTAPLPGEVVRGRARALDGGTISVRGQVYRLVGAAAPGRWASCTSLPTSWMCGQAARDTLDRLLERGPVNCTVVAQDGPATLASCRIGRDDLASAMVDAGMARSGDSALDSRQREAQVDGRGIWNELRRTGGAVRAGK